MNETPEEKKERLAKEALAAANKQKGTEETKPTSSKSDEVADLINLSPQGNKSELEVEASSQYPSLESALKKSAEEEAAGGHPSREFGGAMKGNLAAGLAHAVQDIMGKIKEKNMGNVETVLANKKFLASNPEVASLVNHPVFMQKFPDFWQKIAQKAGIKLK